MIIGVTGGSGSGKSTVTNLLNNKIISSQSLHIDKFMFKYLEKYKHKIVTKLNIVTTDYWRNHIFNSFEDVKLWGEIIAPEIENDIRKYIKNTNTDLVIIDSFMLPLIPIYNDCNLIISVSCSSQIKLERLKNRLKNDGRLEIWNEDALIKRLRYTSFYEENHKYDYNINNNGNLYDLERQIDSIISLEAKKDYWPANAKLTKN